MKSVRRVFIIAEAGVNHNGSLEIAKKLIDAAKKAGVDAIKFQTFKAEKLVSESAPKADYQKRTTSVEESQYDMLKRLELSKEDHVELIHYCRQKRMTFLSSPFDETSADLLEQLCVSAFKIPSGEITNHPFLKHVARKNKPLILSTGMSTLGEVEEALQVIYSTGNRSVTLLHCVTEYPAPFHEINLKAMLTMRQAFQIPVGYSDHTPGLEIALAAVALGAEVIEKHFTLDKNMEGPDHRASLEPRELRAMVRAIRNVEKALGDGIKRPAACELRNIAIARKCIVAAREIKKGETLETSSIALKRSGNGIDPRDLKKIMGLKARVNIKGNDRITWDMLK